MKVFLQELEETKARAEKRNTKLRINVRDIEFHHDERTFVCCEQKSSKLLPSCMRWARLYAMFCTAGSFLRCCT